jgi:hypothetical protein
MDALLQTVTQSVAHDVRELVHATQLEAPPLREIDPPGFHWEWHLPLGFVSLAAVGTLLIAAGGVQWGAQERKHATRRYKTGMHKTKVHVVPSRPGRN